MKRSRADVVGKARTAISLRFEQQELTSFAGLILFQRLFAHLDLKARLRGCFRHVQSSAIYRDHVIVLLLVVHLLLGFRELRDVRYYDDDEMVKRTLGLKHVPDVSTISRALAATDAQGVANLARENRRLVLDRLDMLGLSRLTIDFDGSVVSTGRYAEGTAVGYNNRKKGQRSYYPLFCTIAQTGQVLDVHHRPGNVHDSNGAEAFISACFGALRERQPRLRVETRVDSAFFSEAIVSTLDSQGIEFTVSVPFERFASLKAMVEQRSRWHPIDETLSYFETHWKPKSWPSRYRFVFIRKRVHRQYKAPLQLDLFQPREEGYDFKVIVTNKSVHARKIATFHEGRGAQEGIFAELKSNCHLDYVPVTTLCGNRLYMLSGILAHNLSRELQMIAHPPCRGTLMKRPALWAFEKVSTLQRKLIQRAGRLLRPQGRPVLSMTANPEVENALLQYLDALEAA